MFYPLWHIQILALSIAVKLFMNERSRKLPFFKEARFWRKKWPNFGPKLKKMAQKKIRLPKMVAKGKNPSANPGP